MTSKGRESITVAVSGLSWLTDHTFELRFRRPDHFSFIPGQKIGVMHNSVYRDYSLINSTEDSELAICVRLIPSGQLSPVLAQAKVGDHFSITPAFGFFFHQPEQHPVVFVATGTGIAPYVAFVRDGARDYHLIHGVRTNAERYYHETLIAPARHYTACVSTEGESEAAPGSFFHGRVTTFIEQLFTPGVYDFYLCGRSEMVRDATRIIDARFNGSRVFSELFF